MAPPVFFSARYHDGRMAGTHHVTVHADGDVLNIGDGGAVAASWPLKSIRHGEPTPENEIVLYRRGFADRLIVSDPQLLSALKIRFQPARRLWMWIITGLAVCGAGLFLLIDRAPAWLAPLVPERTEQWFGRQVTGLVTQNHVFCEGREGLQALRRLQQKLSVAAGIDGAVSLDVVDDPAVNALTLPGRHILLLRGLIDASRDPDEMAGVMAHETGHVLYRDPLQPLIRAAGLVVLKMTISGGGWVPAGDIAAQALTLRYSRRQEERADAAAIRFLQTAGLRSDGLAHFFETLEAREKRSMSTAFLSDHPATAARRSANPGSAHGERALDDAAWRAVQHVCDTAAPATPLGK